MNFHAGLYWFIIADQHSHSVHQPNGVKKTGGILTSHAWDQHPKHSNMLVFFSRVSLHSSIELSLSLSCFSVSLFCFKVCTECSLLSTNTAGNTCRSSLHLILFGHMNLSRADNGCLRCVLV